MKRLITSLGCIAALFIAAWGCKTPKLEAGGAYVYSVTNMVGTNLVITSTSDIGLYTADSAFKLAYQTLDLVFNLELNNADYFWKISPEIKHSLDKVRAVVDKAVPEYLAARAAYISNPSSPGLSGLNAILAKITQCVFAAQAAVGVGNGTLQLSNLIPSTATSPTH